MLREQINKISKKQKAEILARAQDWMRNNIIDQHIKNTKKLSSLDELTINPFLWAYLANFYCGNSSAESKAVVAILPRILGTSIATTFGTAMQSFITTVMDESYGSGIKGIDIEYIDCVDGRKKYCQVKSGPQALNRDDVKTISDHFKDLKNLARTNHLPLQTNDMVFGLLYGEKGEENSFVKELANDYTVFMGQEFWFRMTGDKNFYRDLINSMSEVAEEVDSRAIIEDTISKLADDIKKREIK